MPKPMTSPLPPLHDLYERDETAWLERMADLVSQQRFGEIDHEHLAEYLSDTARRDKRETFNRLVTLIFHLLKWEHQPKRRSKSWRLTILEQRSELEQLLESGVLRGHAVKVLGRAYQKAVERAAVETGLPEKTFPAQCPMSLEQVLTGDTGG